MDIATLVNDTTADACHSVLNMTGVIVIVVLSCVVGISWAVFNFILVRRIDV